MSSLYAAMLAGGSTSPAYAQATSGPIAPPAYAPAYGQTGGGAIPHAQAAAAGSSAPVYAHTLLHTQAPGQPPSTLWMSGPAGGGGAAPVWPAAQSNVAYDYSAKAAVDPAAVTAHMHAYLASPAIAPQYRLLSPLQQASYSQQVYAAIYAQLAQVAPGAAQGQTQAHGHAQAQAQAKAQAQAQSQAQAQAQAQMQHDSVPGRTLPAPAPAPSSGLSWPPALQDWVTRAIEAGLQGEAERVVVAAVERGAVWSRDWAREPMPRPPSAAAAAEAAASAGRAAPARAAESQVRQGARPLLPGRHVPVPSAAGSGLHQPAPAHVSTARAAGGGLSQHPARGPTGVAGPRASGSVALGSLGPGSSSNGSSSSGGGSGGGPASAAVAPNWAAMPVAALKQALSAAGVDSSACIDKSELVGLARMFLGSGVVSSSSGSSSGGGPGAVSSSFYAPGASGGGMSGSNSFPLGPRKRPAPGAGLAGEDRAGALPASSQNPRKDAREGKAPAGGAGSKATAAAAERDKLAWRAARLAMGSPTGGPAQRLAPAPDMSRLQLMFGSGEDALSEAAWDPMRGTCTTVEKRYFRLVVVSAPAAGQRDPCLCVIEALACAQSSSATV